MKNIDCRRGKSGIFFLVLNLAVICWCPGVLRVEAAFAAEEKVAESASKEYHTPLAGESGEVTFLGQRIPISARNRRQFNDLGFGGTLFSPRQGKSQGLPVGMLFLRREKEAYRTRDIIAIFYNELEYDKRFRDFELVTHFENYTLPGDIPEIQDNQEIQQTEVTWGDAVASVGPGLRIPVAEKEIDNNFKVQLLGRIGYMYAEKSHHTGPDVVIPPDTALFGSRLRVRYDGLRRNLLELPHRGLAAGFDLDYMHRDRWKALSPGAGVHRDYMQVNGYFEAAAGIPRLSEKNRILVNINGGTTSGDSADRFNAFTMNGGPFPGEEDDLIRPHYAGMFYNDVRCTSFITGSAGYRRELAFFMYVSVLGSYIWAERASVKNLDQVFFRGQNGTSVTVSLDSAFLWDSAFYLAYTWESGFIRNGKAGSGVTLLWNKMF